jgi:hypothetical protein
VSNVVGVQIQRRIARFYSRLKHDPYHCYRSWEHCYWHFRDGASIKTRQQVDLAALHLAFYLASWGMYRGSSFLLWKDYTIHRPAVLVLLRREFVPLWNLNVARLDDSGISLILALADALKAEYEKNASVDGESRKPSNILITKILLGTVGCTPACDRYFVSGLKKTGLRNRRFGRKFLINARDFYLKHKVEFDRAQRRISKKAGFRYPIMKLVDMYFWELGFQAKM